MYLCHCSPVTNCQMSKLSDNEFWALLRENAGLYAKTANAIREQFDVNFTRQSVRERAEKAPEKLADIRAENVDIAEDGLNTLMQSTDENIQFKSIQFYLKTQGKGRGYVERTEQEVNSKISVNIYPEDANF